MSPEKRVTLKEIAAAANLSPSAVSLALRNHPSMAKSTRERVRQLAEKMGYQPDPYLSALSRRRNRKPANAVIGWITNWPAKYGWQNASPVYRRYFAGATERAGQIGFRLEHFWLGDDSPPYSRIEQILLTRNIRALLLAPLPVPPLPYELTWSRYATVTFGSSISRPAMHRVSFSAYRSMTTVLQKLHERGYRKIGCALTIHGNQRVEQGWLAAFLTYQYNHPEHSSIPPLITDKTGRAQFNSWFSAHRPDVIVTVGSRFPSTVRDWCAALKISIPGDCGLAIASNVGFDSDASGIREPSEDMGAMAVEILTGMLYRNEFGPPAISRQTILDGLWIEGKTLRPPRAD